MKVSNIYKRQTFIIVGIICILLIVFVSISYAYFNSVLKSDNNLVIKSGDLEVSYTGSDTITGNFIPMGNADGLETDGYTFTINNTGTLTSSFKVEIYADTSVTGTHVPHQYLMVSLNGEEPRQLSTLTKTTTGGTESGNVYLLGTGTVERSKTSTNTIRLWLKDDSPTSIIDNKVAFKIKVTNEVFKGELIGQQPICIRAKTLHTETCEDLERSDGYCTATNSVGLDSTVTYGNLGTNGQLNVGDAFTCDVNGDGVYDEETERFYYVSDYYDTINSTETNSIFDQTTASLIYYSNTLSGIYDITTEKFIQYNQNGSNKDGPITASLELPTVNQWKNINLKTTNRQIRTITNTTVANSANLAIYNYDNKAARLLTYQEMTNACGNTGMTESGYLDNPTCRFFLENTKFTSYNNGTYGYWLETVDDASVWSVHIFGRFLTNANANVNYRFGVRPVIDVPKTYIQY